MTLINCPECNKEISDKALMCPNCGFAAGNRLFTYEYRSKKELFGLPLVHIVYGLGIDPLTGKFRVAKGIIAIGNIAVGGLAIRIVHHEGADEASVLLADDDAALANPAAERPVVASDHRHLSTVIGLQGFARYDVGIAIDDAEDAKHRLNGALVADLDL